MFDRSSNMEFFQTYIVLFLRNGFVRILGQLLATVLGVILARRLGASELGVYAFTMSLVSMLAIPSQLGFPHFVVRSTAILKGDHSYGLLAGLRTFSLSVTAASATLTALVSGVFIHFYSESAGALQPPVITVGLFLLPFLSVSAVLQAMVRGYGFPSVAIFPDSVVRPALVIVGVLGLSWLGFQQSAKSVLIITLVALASQVVLFYSAEKYSQPACLASYSSEFEGKAWLREAVPFLFVGVVATILSRTDLIVLGFLKTEADVGVYRTVVSSATFVMFAPQAVNQVLVPKFALAAEDTDSRNLQALLNGAALYATLACAPIAIALIWRGREILSILFGQSFETGAPALSILSAGFLLVVSLGPVEHVLSMAGHARYTARIATFAAVLNVVLCMSLIPKFGTEGASAATAISLFMSIVGYYFVAGRLLKIKPPVSVYLRQMIERF